MCFQLTTCTNTQGSSFWFVIYLVIYTHIYINDQIGNRIISHCLELLVAHKIIVCAACRAMVLFKIMFPGLLAHVVIYLVIYTHDINDQIGNRIISHCLELLVAHKIIVCAACRAMVLFKIMFPGLLAHVVVNYNVLWLLKLKVFIMFMDTARSPLYALFACSLTSSMKSESEGSLGNRHDDFASRGIWLTAINFL